MSEGIIIAVLSLAGTLLGSLLGVVANGKLIGYRLQQLEKEVEKHNNLVERTYELERRIGAQEQALQAHEDLYAEKIKVANHRIDDLEHGHGH